MHWFTIGRLADVTVLVRLKHKGFDPKKFCHLPCSLTLDEIERALEEEAGEAREVS